MADTNAEREGGLSPDLPLDFHFISDVAPVQAEGTIASHPFYFRARGSLWTFAVSEAPDVDPVELESDADERGLGWWCDGEIGRPGEFRASYLTHAEATTLIRGCAAAYMLARAT